jgi:EAL domain-containing protein (putative c-di-GMP-specific phosphodiesterase class I)
LIEESGVPGCCFDVELCEHGAVQHVVLSGSAFEQLRSDGVGIAIGGFPEGGASLLRLSRYKLDKVKLDPCLLPQVDDSVATWLKKRQILTTLADMIVRSGAAPVIGGVEREVQYKFLASLPVREWQGCLWGGPVALDELLPQLAFPQATPTDARSRGTVHPIESASCL